MADEKPDRKASLANPSDAKRSYGALNDIDDRQRSYGALRGTPEPPSSSSVYKSFEPPRYAEGGAVKPNYDKFATDPERWSKVGRMGFDPDAPNPSIKGEDYPKKGSYTVPKMCGGGKVIKTWSK